jgi:hypothetical protein
MAAKGEGVCCGTGQYGWQLGRRVLVRRLTNNGQRLSPCLSTGVRSPLGPGGAQDPQRPPPCADGGGRSPQAWVVCVQPVVRGSANHAGQQPCLELDQVACACCSLACCSCLAGPGAHRVKYGYDRANGGHQPVAGDRRLVPPRAGFISPWALLQCRPHLEGGRRRARV